MEAGAVAGRIRYSPEMELEADQLATYIVREAGYDLRAARKLFIRMARAEQRAAAQGQRGLVGVPEDTPDRRAADRTLERDEPAHRGRAAAAGEHGERRGTGAPGTARGQMRTALPGVPRVPGLGQGGAPGVRAVGENDEGSLPVPGPCGLRGAGVEPRLRQAETRGARPEPDAAEPR